MSKVVGFLSNKLTLRGTEIALYDYADFNETLLGNKSIVITRDYERVKHEFDVHPDAYLKMCARFNVKYYETREDIDEIVEKNGITHLYIIKSGQNDGLLSTKCKNLVHCVFNTNSPHGEVYASISDEVNRLCNTNVPVVPHMIRVADTDESLRASLGIPYNAIVIGTYGGADSFNIPFVYGAVIGAIHTRNDLWFLAMNTQPFCWNHPRMKFMNGTSDLLQKRKFINTCDVFLHARNSGETFGLACGEFATCLKPVITFADSREKNHIEILKDKAVLYRSEPELFEILTTLSKDKYDMGGNGYLQYTPQNVMAIFNHVFLDK